jgi:NAD(P)-dependent dehydrogenase (short-subunit alcohol dehydrogenase family)
VIVTGGGRGLGRAYALLLAARGAAVVVDDVGRDLEGRGPVDADPAGAVAAEIVAAGGRAIASTADVTTPEGAAAVVSAALECFGGVSAVVHSAGVIRFAPLGETTEDDLRRQLAVDAFGGLNLARAAWPHLVASGAGRIVLTTSAAAFGGAEQTAYGTAKASVIGLTRCLAAAGAADGVCANAVAPYGLSRMTFVGAAVSDDELHRREAVAGPERVAPLVAVLTHPRCPTSGELYAAAGGRVARVVLAQAEGYLDVDLTPESLLAHWDEVEALDGYEVVGQLQEHTDRFYASLPGWRTPD